MQQPVVLIAGGDGKGQNFSPLAAAVAARARAVVLIGRDAARIARVLEPTRVVLLRADNMTDAVAAYEKDLIQDALKTTRGNRAKAARLLDTTERIMNYKVRQLGIDWRRFRK